MEAIQSATSLAAKHMGWADRVGSLQPGRFGDLVAVRGNPLADVKQSAGRGSGHQGRIALQAAGAVGVDAGAAPTQTGLYAAAVTGAVARLGAQTQRIVAPNPSALTGPGHEHLCARHGRRALSSSIPARTTPTHLERVVAAANGRVAQDLLHAFTP